MWSKIDKKFVLLLPCESLFSLYQYLFEYLIGKCQKLGKCGSVSVLLYAVVIWNSSPIKWRGPGGDPAHVGVMCFLRLCVASESDLGQVSHAERAFKIAEAWMHICPVEGQYFYTNELLPFPVRQSFIFQNSMKYVIWGSVSITLQPPQRWISVECMPHEKLLNFKSVENKVCPKYISKMKKTYKSKCSGFQRRCFFL